MLSVRKFDAVVFDLWGTLVDDPATDPRYVRMTAEVSGLLGVDQTDFASAWSAAWSARVVGHLPSTAAAHVHVCRELGVEPNPDSVRASAEVRYAYIRGALAAVRPGVSDALAELTEAGYRIGLVSNCSVETSRLWASTTFADLIGTAMLSCDVGLAKPAPRIYALATQRLDVVPERCLYVGDGSEDELSGATTAGMTAVLMRAPYDLADGSRQGWDGLRISAIPDVLRIVA